MQVKMLAEDRQQVIAGPGHEEIPNSGRKATAAAIHTQLRQQRSKVTSSCDNTHLRCKLAGGQLIILVVIFWIRLSTQLAQGLQNWLHQLLLCQLLGFELCQPIHDLHVYKALLASC